jgi:glycine/D-amino acid oxidase-like deaminating enzyme
MVPDRQARNWKVGSTYYFHDREDGITEVARRDLQDRIAGLIKTGFEIVDQQWGFRPTTPDRRPILGRHPEFERLVVFNGLGTKGVTLAPYFSEVLIHWLEKGGQLHKEVDIERFKSVYSGSPKRYGVS